MASILEKKPSRETPKELLKKRDLACEKLGTALLQAINFAIEKVNT